MTVITLNHGAFTLPNTVTDINTDKLQQNPIVICVGFWLLKYEHLHTILHNLLLSVSASVSVSKLVGVNRVHSLCRSGVPSPSPSSEGASPALASSAPSSALKPDTSSTPTPVTRQVFCEMCESSVSSASSHSSSAQHMLDDYIGDLMLHFGNTLNISFKSKYYYEFCCKVQDEVETIITGSSEG